MDEQSRRDEQNVNDAPRRATNDTSNGQLDDVMRRRTANQRQVLTKREQEERWPIG